MNILHKAAEVEQYVIELRRYFHETPEISGKEENTINKIRYELDKLGIKFIQVPKGGIIAEIDGASAGKTVLLRADIDALPMQEEEYLPGGIKRNCVSKNPGIMHSCGHDGHIAMLIGTAKILAENRSEIKGKVLLVFERGEEIGCGIPHLVRYFMEEKINFDTCWGIHLWAGYPTGKISLLSGNAMAASMPFEIKITGKGGHGSRPDQSINPIECFTAVMHSLNSLRMRRISPFSPMTFSIGSVHAGTAVNIIPETLIFSGTARSFDRETSGLPFQKEFINVIKKTCELYSCSFEILELKGPKLSVWNDPELADLAKKALTDTFGESVFLIDDPIMGSESFPSFQKLAPGVFAFVGIKNEQMGTGAEHHNPKFDIDEDALKTGIAATLAYCFGFLNSDIETGSRKWDKSLEELLRIGGSSDHEIEELTAK